MPEFKYQLGDIVALDPTGREKFSPIGKVIGRTEYIDGTAGYVVAAADYKYVARHSVTEYEIRPLPSDEVSG